MQIKRIFSQNIGPIEKANIEFFKNEDNTPKPVILVGENGSGKSTIISNIVDSLYEIAGKAYNNVLKGENNVGHQYYKAILSSEINVNHEFMISYIEFCESVGEDIICEYIFKNGNLTYNDFNNETGFELKNRTVFDINSVKDINISKEKVEEIFKKNIFCYFGPDRYEKPCWLGEKYYVDKEESDIHLSIKNIYSGILNNPISVKNVTDETLKWLLDVIVDSRVDIDFIDGVLNYTHVNIYDTLKLGVARKNIEKVMGEILGKKIYFGLNFRSRNSSRFNILDSENNKVIVPTLDALSTGQSALFNMFATIIRYADSNNINKSIINNEIEGIVVIDEIELHLHPKLQREVLPKLLKLFPKVQFIITTHSPLFLLGMDEQYGRNGYCIYQMPDAEIISSEGFTEFQNAYKYMAHTETFEREIKNEIKNRRDKTLIVTEGATDWRHLKSALRYFKNYENIYNDLDIEFLEYNSKNCKEEELPVLEMSCSNLVTMCKEFAKLQQPRKIIFIADADDKYANNNLKDKEYKYKNWGNDVYSFVLPVPKHRIDNPNICIEHYYIDDDLKRSIEINGIERRIYMGCEFNKNGLSNDKEYMCLDRKSCGQDKICIIDGQSEKKVFRISDTEENNLALSKMMFADAIYKEKDEMKNINFSEFKLVFDIIKQIIDEE